MGFLTSAGVVTALSSCDATPEQRRGALSRFDARRIVTEFQDGSSRHDLVALYTLATGSDLYLPSGTSTLTMISAVAAALEAGRMILVEGWASPGHPPLPSKEPGAPVPTQLRREGPPQHWVEIAIVYEDGSPFGGTCIVNLPDGRVIDNLSGEAGIIRFDDLTSGNCKVKFPDLDAAAFATG